jgi:hyperosmotically inducible periplasmic protein
MGIQNCYRVVSRPWSIAFSATFLLLLTVSLVPLTLSVGAQVSDNSGSPSQAPDNAAANRPGNSPDANRADQQGFSENDREITRKIRKAVIADKSLSTYAHNVKIISRNGVVTLKGPVRSDQEKNTIDSAATQIAGAANVKDELTIKPKI